jgi:hypothetical protein
MLEQKRVRSNIPTKSCFSQEGNEESSRLAFLGNNLQPGADKSNKSNNNDQAKMLGRKSRSTATNLVVNIHIGTASPAQKQAWGRFWQKIVIEVKKETSE